MFEPNPESWYAQVEEDVVDPTQPIVDAHHHLWPDRTLFPYEFADLWVDTHDGHAIGHTVFMECSAAYLAEGPRHLRPTGETAFVAGVAHADSTRLIGGIVGHADLADVGHLDEALDVHTDLARGLFRGIRDRVVFEPDRAARMGGEAAHRGRYADLAFRTGVARLGARGLTYDAHHHFHQNRDFAELARAVPDTVMVLDHLGTPLTIGSYAARREEVVAEWRASIAEIARCENVVAKLGGLAMPNTGLGWSTADRPPTSDELVAAHGDYYRHTIECFGPERCMFESNFPIDRLSLSYRVLWNGLKKIAAPYSPDEREAMLVGTATKVYRLSP